MIGPRRMLPAFTAFMATLAIAAAALAADAKGYLTREELPAITAWLPPQPAKGSAEEQADIDRYLDRKSTRLNSSHTDISRMPSSA